MATYCSILAWEIPWTEEPGGLQSMESQKSWTGLSDQTTTIISACAPVSLLLKPVTFEEGSENR